MNTYIEHPKGECYEKGMLMCEHDNTRLELIRQTLRSFANFHCYDTSSNDTNIRNVSGILYASFTDLAPLTSPIKGSQIQRENHPSTLIHLSTNKLCCIPKVDNLSRLYNIYNIIDGYNIASRCKFSKI